MNKDQLFRFCLIATEQDLIKHLIISSCIFRHKTSDWLQYKISPEHMVKYQVIIEDFIKQYKL